VEDIASIAVGFFGQPSLRAEHHLVRDVDVAPFARIQATPLDMKAEADLHFLQGINQLIGHGWPYTAPGVEYPGWRFYAAAVFDEKNPWWIVMPDIARYLQRVSFMMRQGTPANDVAIYLPNADAWSSFRNGQVHMIDALRERIGDQVVASTIEGGYGFDFFDDDALKLTGRVDKGVLQMGSNRYKAVILPNVERMPVETLLGLEEFAKSGGIVIATRRWPIAAPGLKSPDAEKALIKAVTQRLFEAPNAPGIVIADETQLAGKLAARLKPDVDFSSGKSEMGFVHRHTEDAEIYFIANTSNQRQQLTATFRVGGSTAQFWDPFTGTIAGQAGFSGKRGAIEICVWNCRAARYRTVWLADRRLHAAAINDLSSHSHRRI
jgi:hypothetical protein